jgi:hypothetical protein
MIGDLPFWPTTRCETLGFEHRNVGRDSNQMRSGLNND